MRLYGFINVFNQNPTFLQPVFCKKRTNNRLSYFFQHSENKTTITSFEDADLEYYKDYSELIILPINDIEVQVGSAVIFAVILDAKIYWGDFIDIQNFIISHEVLQQFSPRYPGFAKTCQHYLEEYHSKTVKDDDIPPSLKQEIKSDLFFYPNSSETDDSKFVDLYFWKKEVPKFWTISLVADLIYSRLRIRRSEQYVKSLINDFLQINISEPLVAFREKIAELNDVQDFEFDFSIKSMIEDEDIQDFYIIDFIKCADFYSLTAENYITKRKRFMFFKSDNKNSIQERLFTMIEELLKESSDKLFLILNSKVIQECYFKNKADKFDQSKIEIVEYPASSKVDC